MAHANPPKVEPHNPFYLLLLVASLLFVVNALAYALIPVLEEKAAERGERAPPSEFRSALRADGWKWLLGELAAMIVLGLASMALDRARLRRLKSQASPATMPPPESNLSTPSAPVSHEEPGPADRGAAPADPLP